MRHGQKNIKLEHYFVSLLHRALYVKTYTRFIVASDNNCPETLLCFASYFYVFVSDM